MISPKIINLTDLNNKTFKIFVGTKKITLQNSIGDFIIMSDLIGLPSYDYYSSNKEIKIDIAQITEYIDNDVYIFEILSNNDLIRFMCYGLQSYKWNSAFI